MSRFGRIALSGLATTVALCLGGCFFAFSTEKVVPTPAAPGYVATNVAIPANASLVFYGMPADLRDNSLPKLPDGMLYIYDENDRQIVAAVAHGVDAVPDLKSYMRITNHKYRVYFSAGVPTPAVRGNI